MPTAFTCPHCGAQTDVSDEYAGRSGPCAQCGKTISIPPSGDVAPEITAARPPSITTIVIILAVFLVAAVLCSGFVLLPMVSATREKGRQAACANNLKRIGQALRQYRAKYGSFPPAYIAGEQGRPMHSWRVLLLPYLDEDSLALYRQYNFKEPWDSPRNLALASRMPAVYRCPSDVQESESGSAETSYVGITGPGTVFDGVKPENFLRPELGKGFIPLGPGNVILVAEQSQSGINWLEPRDLDVEQMSRRINDPAGNAMRSNHVRDHVHGANVLMCDGQVRFLDDSTEPRQLREMMTISAGEDAWLTPRDGKHKAATGGRAP